MNLNFFITIKTGKRLKDKNGLSQEIIVDVKKRSCKLTNELDREKFSKKTVVDYHHRIKTILEATLYRDLLRVKSFVSNKKCPRCNQQESLFAENEKHCPHCGSGNGFFTAYFRSRIECPRCQIAIRTDSEVCEICGFDIKEAREYLLKNNWYETCKHCGKITVQVIDGFCVSCNKFSDKKNDLI